MQNENMFKVIKENFESAGLNGRIMIKKHLPPEDKWGSVYLRIIRPPKQFIKTQSGFLVLLK